MHNVPWIKHLYICKIAIPAVAICCSHVLLVACTASSTSSFEIARNVEAKVDGANCTELRNNMQDALASLSTAKKAQTAGGIATGAGMALSLVPGGAIVSALTSGAGIASRNRGIYGTVEPEVLYRASHTSYHQKGCKPRIPFGE